MRLVRRVVPVTSGLREGRFIVSEGGKRAVTPLFVALIMVESADVLFAVDSVPAIFAVTSDPFLVYSSNTFAILGLRSLYFALAPILGYFRFLRPSLVLILAFIGFKMLMLNHVHIPIGLSLLVVIGAITAGVFASIVVPIPHSLPSPVESERESLMRMTVGIAVRSVVLVVGSTVILFGTALLVLPTVGMTVVTLGLSVLGTQFVWAKRLLTRVSNRTKK
ncbi:MAG: hypothetical protein O2958_12760 [Gemmatimonadetes bacterium]|nr:hypothetical protein [Gemmatimonadota bacterium]MDA1103192.1 hypothetical protein [Gemmatimonadota bacterium]